jgi:hypothetical protein
MPAKKYNMRTRLKCGTFTYVHRVYKFNKFGCNLREMVKNCNFLVLILYGMGPYTPLEVTCAGGDDYAHTAQRTFNDIWGIMMCADSALKSIYQTDDSP